MSIRLVIALWISISLYACKKEPTVDKQPIPDDRPLIILTGTDISTFDPQVPFDETDNILANIYRPLIEFDPSFQIAPGLARRWTNPDDKTWRFYLDENARFSDGTFLKASDVKFSIERLKTLTESDRQGFVENISEIRIVNDHTIDIVTETPMLLLHDLAFVPIMSEQYVKKVGVRIAEMPMGSGAYRLARWEKDKKIVLQINEYFTPRPAFSTVEFIVSSDPEKVIDDVKRLHPDLTLALPYRKIEEFQKLKLKDLQIQSSNGIAVFYISFNLKPRLNDFPGKNPLSDLRVRKALGHATNKKEIVDKILKGFGRVASQLVAPEVFGYDPSIPDIPYDPELAQKLLKEAGYDHLKLPIYTTEGGSHRLENLLMEQWARAGIATELRIIPSNDFNELLNRGAYTMFIIGYRCSSGDAGEILTFAFHTRKESGGPGRGNYAFYSNPGVDWIARENLKALNPKRRLEMIQESLRIVSQDLPYLPLMIYNDVYIVSNRIQWTPPVNGQIYLNQIKPVKP